MSRLRQSMRCPRLYLKLLLRRKDVSQTVSKLDQDSASLPDFSDNKFSGSKALRVT